jgi:hypothetical protein
MYRSLNTVKADLARAQFDLTGEGIVWAVLATGVDGSHSWAVRSSAFLHKPPAANIVCFKTSQKGGNQFRSCWLVEAVALFTE